MNVESCHKSQATMNDGLWPGLQRRITAESDYKGTLLPIYGKIREKCESCQLGIGTKGGGTQLVMVITRLLLEANPGWVVIALDIVNAFNEIDRQSILEAIWDKEEIRPLWYYNMCCKTVAGFVGLGYGPGMVKAPFRCEEGRKTGRHGIDAKLLSRH